MNVQYDEKNKRCSTCQTIKSIEEFEASKINRDGLEHSCKMCNTQKQRKSPGRPKKKSTTKVEKTLMIDEEEVRKFAKEAFDRGYRQGFDSALAVTSEKGTQKLEAILEEL